MRLSLIVAIAVVLTPAALSAQTVGTPGLKTSTEVSAAKKKAKKPAKKKEENLKAAPSAPPSGGKSTY